MTLSKIKAYATYAVERAVEAGAAAGLSLLVADQSGVLHANWQHIGEVALGATAASLLSSLRAFSAKPAVAKDAPVAALAEPILPQPIAFPAPAPVAPVDPVGNLGPVAPIEPPAELAAATAATAAAQGAAPVA